MRGFMLAAAAVVAATSLAAAAEQRAPASTLTPKAVTRADGKYVSITSGLSATSSRPGGTVTLILDLAPRPGLHVYAPGQAGYQVVTLTLAPSTSFKAAAPVYPPAKSMYFEPDQSHIKVYDAPFRITEGVTLAAGARGDVEVRGTLTYQACDDAVCYRTDAVPLRWQVDVVG